MPTDTFPLQKKKNKKNQRNLVKDNTGTLAHISTYDAILSYSTLYKYLNLKNLYLLVSYKKKKLVHIFILNTIIIDK